MILLLLLLDFSFSFCLSLCVREKPPRGGLREDQRSQRRRARPPRVFWKGKLEAASRLNLESAAGVRNARVCVSCEYYNCRCCSARCLMLLLLLDENTRVPVSEYLGRVVSVVELRGTIEMDACVTWYSYVLYILTIMIIKILEFEIDSLLYVYAIFKRIFFCRN